MTSTPKRLKRTFEESEDEEQSTPERTTRVLETEEPEYTKTNPQRIGIKRFRVSPPAANLIITPKEPEEQVEELSDAEDRWISSQSNQIKSTVIDAEFIIKIRRELNLAFAEVADKMGLQKMELVGNIDCKTVIGTITGSFKGVAVVMDEMGEQMTEEQIRWNEHCFEYPGLTKSDWGKQVILKGRFAGRRASMYTIKPRNRLYPIIVRMIDNRKHVKLSPQQALTYLGKANQ